ncbi:hypothetical protein Y958_24205 [Nitrospirillum viridazoti CBAmc]|uniref:Uncharacterized protein n=2 Tax=Nitrospirillum TaxID=1543705 RepID=A0A248JZQ8_9PROT|nr:hypothetical protein Y958_24205 [Nitrospirillum amazonense CBAmc]
MRVSPEFTATIDDWRRHQRDIPARAEAIRRLVELALLAEETLPVAIQVSDFLKKIEGGGLLEDALKAEAKVIVDAIGRLEKALQAIHGAQGLTD